MIDWIKSKVNLKADSCSDEEYCNCIKEVAQTDIFLSMENYVHHGKVSCLEHSLHVSYCSYLISKRLGLDFLSTARGALLHDFFLYDWHSTKTEGGLHGFTHPKLALENANQYFELNEVEKDIILKHMWPLTWRLPKFKESFVVMLADKYCATIETFGVGVDVARFSAGPTGGTYESICRN